MRRADSKRPQFSMAVAETREDDKLELRTFANIEVVSDTCQENFVAELGGFCFDYIHFVLHLSFSTFEQIHFVHHNNPSDFSINLHAKTTEGDVDYEVPTQTSTTI
jgi:hypothetical protein